MGLCNHLWLGEAGSNLAGWYHQLDYAVGQGCGLGSTIAPGLAGHRAALLNWIVLLDGLHVQVGCGQTLLVG